MLKKLKLMIREDIENIEVEEYNVEIERLEKELIKKEKQVKYEYRGSNKIKVLMIDCLKFNRKEDGEGWYSRPIIVFIVCFLIIIGNIFSFYLFLTNENYSSKSISLLVELIVSFIILKVSLNKKIRPYRDIEALKFEIEENQNKLNEIPNYIKKMFDTSSYNYKEYTDIPVSEFVLKEAIKVLNAETIKFALRLSGGDNIKYCYLIKAIIEQEENEKLTGLYDKIKNSQ